MNRKILCMTYREHLTAPAVNTEPCAGDCYGGRPGTYEEWRAVIARRSL